MRKTGFVSFADFLVLLGLTGAFARPAAENSFVIRNVRLFDGSRVTEKTDVWVEDGKIKAVGGHLKTPAGTETIDGSGKTLLPGLIDAHVHA